jgi:hypothetical protein
VEPEALDLSDRRHLRAEFRAEHAQEERAEALPRIGDVAQAKTGVDEHQAVVGFDQQAMRGEVAAFDETCPGLALALAGRAGGHAIEMMDPHRSGDSRRRSVWATRVVRESGRRVAWACLLQRKTRIAKLCASVYTRAFIPPVRMFCVSAGLNAALPF